MRWLLRCAAARMAATRLRSLAAVVGAEHAFVTSQRGPAMRLPAVLDDAVRRLRYQQSIKTRSCSHVQPLGAHPPPGAAACLACESEGLGWVHLRMCLACGSVGCCDTSRGRHARAHFEASGHPIVRSVEAGEAWGWCYPDQAYLPPSRLGTHALTPT